MSYVLNSGGAIVGPGGGNPSARATITWDPVNSRLYYFRDGSSQRSALRSDRPATGLVTSDGETPYHGSYDIVPPIRVSVNGQYVLLGSGDFYDQDGLTWVSSLGNQVTDARWLTNGSLVTLTTAGNETTVRRLNGAAHALLEQRAFTGQALRVVGSDTAMVVIVLNNGASTSTVMCPARIPTTTACRTPRTRSRWIRPLPWTRITTGIPMSGIPASASPTARPG